MKLVTRNSVYEIVTMKDGGLGLRKSGEIKPSSFNALWQVRPVQFLRIQIGEPIDCGEWHTSELIRIEW